MEANKKIETLMLHTGWEQVADLQQIGVTEQQMPQALLENAQNQTGISVTEEEEKGILAELKSLYC